MLDDLLIVLRVLLVLTTIAAVTVAVVRTKQLAATRHRLDETTSARDALMLRDRDLAISSSHRLRTPITALRLSLEDLALWPQTHPEVAEELGRAIEEIDRWGEAVDDVLGDRSGRRALAATAVDLSEMTSRFVAAHADEVGPRGITHRTRGPVPAHLDPTAVDDVLSRLLEHLVTHGSGPIRVDVAARDSHLQVRLADTGPRSLTPGVVRPEIVGLDERLGEAGAIAESFGGYVAVEDRPTTRFLLLLPAREEPAIPGLEGPTG